MTDREERSMPERRTQNRRSTGRLPLISGLSSGRLVNLSSTGFAIETDRGLRVGEYYGFGIRRDPSDELGPTRLLCGQRFEGTVRWCTLRRTRQVNGEVAPVFLAGFEFATTGSKSTKDTGFIDFSLPAT